MTTFDEALSWWVVRSATRREAAAQASLEAMGMSVWLPVERRWAHPFRSPTRTVVERPLFPGYLLVLAREGEIASAWGAEGVHAVVCCHRSDESELRPLAVPLSVVLGLQAEEAKGDFDQTRSIRPPYRPKKGAKVMIEAGTWMGFMARVLATPRGERAQVMVEGPFGRGHTIDVKHLSAA